MSRNIAHCTLEIGRKWLDTEILSPNDCGRSVRMGGGEVKYCYSISYKCIAVTLAVFSVKPQTYKKR